MNKIFRVIWNSVAQRYVVASELAKGNVKSQSSCVVAGNSPVKAIAFSGVAMAIALAFPSANVLAAGTVVANNSAEVIDGQDIIAAGTAEQARGLSATNGGTIDFSNGTLTTSAATGFGAFADAGTSVSLKNTDINTAGSRAHGIYAKAGGSVTGDGVNIATTGSTAYGVQTSSGYVTLTNSSIKTSGTSAVGAWAQGTTGNLTLTDTDIKTTGDNAHALYAMQGGQMTVNEGAISAAGHTAVGAYATGAGSTITINNSSITTAGSSSEAVYALNGGTVNLTSTNIYTDRINSYGLRANGANSTVNFDGGTVTASGPTRTTQALNKGQLNIRNATLNSQSYAVDIEGGSSANLENVIINASGLGIFVTSPGSQLTAKNVQINNTTSNQIGMQVLGGATATLNNLEINQSGIGKALEIFNGSTLVGDNVKININGNDTSVRSHGISLGGTIGDNRGTLSNTYVNLSGANSAGLLFTSTGDNSNSLSLTDSVVSATEGAAMVVYGKTDSKVTTSGTVLTGATLLSVGIDHPGTLSNVELTGDNGSVFNGDVVIERANTATNLINLDHSSAWNGATSTLENLNVSNGSVWNVTKSSAVDNLTLDNGTLNMTAPGTGFSEVTVGSLNSNNGTLDFKTHLMDDSSQTDHLHITGDYTGNSNIVVQNAGGTGAQTIDGIELIQVDGRINGTFTQQGRIVAGAYDYHMMQDGNKWLLESNALNVPGQGSGGGAGTISPAKGAMITRPEAGTYAANLAASNTLFNTTLDDRLGETHYVDAAGKEQVTSLWLRNVGGHNSFSDSSGQTKTTGNRYVMQLGGDIAQWSSNGNDRFHLGVMGGYANAQSNTHSKVTGYSSEGQVQGYSTGVYATWLQDNLGKTGAYLDSWALYNWFDNSVQGEGLGEESYKSKGITAAVEAGYTFNMANISDRQSVYLQPKAQLSCMGVKADDVKERNGTRVIGEGNNNVQSRLGLRAFIKGHSPIDDGKNRTFEPFIEANWVHNTETYGSSLNGVSIHQAGARNLAEVKVGVDAKLNNTLNLWGNIGQQVGDKGYSDTGAMVGIKMNF